MPIEIRELIIRAMTTNKEEKEKSAQPQVINTTEVREEIIEECVRQVLKILEKQKDR